VIHSVLTSDRTFASYDYNKVFKYGLTRDNICYPDCMVSNIFWIIWTIKNIVKLLYQCDIPLYVSTMTSQFSNHNVYKAGPIIAYNGFSPEILHNIIHCVNLLQYAVFKNVALITHDIIVWIWHAVYMTLFKNFLHGLYC
jgi:hypothetical protein